MDVSLQILLVLSGSGALIGALVTPLIYWAKRRKPASGFFAGVIAGGLGSLLLLIPLWLLLKPRPVNMLSGAFSVAAAYNLGVAAVLGNRLEEARYYFVQVTAVDARHIGAWLYLANLSSSPQEAWSFIQQARAVDPSNPYVMEAVSIVWPQVQPYYADGTARPAPGLPPNPLNNTPAYSPSPPRRP